ncbi:hypothetical protein PAT3040_02294 [Paenibacillus agaridevorans]|uniref:Uncharacterized protein n=1 Tax=Paenibacillus agaridevorans TaxID=171404 RepID=A0A2R5EWH2_9BACL|nr:hypothetical protein [Paenibacillus agaridevorans]GBG07734.1 hypothetical protein PAT3040_02294 [Paenibacillus agaridevorans]
MEKLKNGKVFIWMQLLGFDREDSDRGAARFLDQTGFLPDGACALLFHPDFVNQYKGMDEEYELPADNCAYYGIPRNAERERQPWTNYNLRDLSGNLSDSGTGLYAGIMGVSIGDSFHQEWISDHPELQFHTRGGKRRGLFALKRFKNGAYYEDFFVEQLCRTLVDYGFKGIHLADGFSPSGNIYHGDYSTDMVTQFIDHTGLILPDGIVAALGDDEAEAEDARADWIWKNVRAEWIEFMCWRWESFFKKICARVHAIGREVMVLGMYCTDPFETKYCLGTDLARIMNAGVDYLTANILPTSCFIASPWDTQDYYFHRYMAIAPITAAHIRQGHLVSMVGLQDATEEWDMMKHVPCLHERDLYTMMAYQLAEKGGSRRALEGYFLCLGDGIKRADWDWERERMEIAFSADVDRTLSPTMLWSDHAYENMLAEYIQTRRWTPFKLFYELAKAGTHCGACVRSEDLDSFTGTLLVPDFDMLSLEEQRKVAAYDRGAVVCTAHAGFEPAAYGIQPTILFADRFSNRPLTAFAFGASPDEDTRAAIEALLTQDDGKPNLEGDPADAPDFPYTLVDTLPFVKVTTGFRDALARLLLDIGDCPLTCDKPYLAYRLKDGTCRLYLFNDNDVHYRRAFVTMKEPVADTRTVSSFPILPVRYKDAATGGLTHHYVGGSTYKQSFEVKLQPGGVTLIDVYPEAKTSI